MPFSVEQKTWVGPDGSHNHVEVTLQRKPQVSDMAKRRSAKQLARDRANETAEVMSRVMRTGAKAAGREPALYGASPLELQGNQA